MERKGYVIGIDFGTDSARALIVDASNGAETATAVAGYRRWADSDYCDPASNCFRQHPLDYIESMEQAIADALAKAPGDVARNIRGISVDTTGSTPVAVNRNGTPLSLTPEFADDPDAMFILWKDHTGIKEAGEINTLAHRQGGTDYTKYCGGIYSSEWFWAKILHALRRNEKLRGAAYSWLEHCDWIPALLTGSADISAVKRSRCAAGHKAMWHAEFNGLPSQEFLSQLDPLLDGIRSRLFNDTFTADMKAGNLSPEWAKRLGLSTDVAVGVGAFDAHMGAVGGGIRPYTLSKVMGTSTCDMVIAPMGDVKDKLIKGICGQVDGSIVPGMMGLEAGQSAFGDIYAWFRQLLLWPYETILKKKHLVDDRAIAEIEKTLDDLIIPELSEKAQSLPDGDDAPIALDWHNGRRTPDADQSLKGAIMNLGLGSDAPRLFRALVEATAFGARKITERFESEGIEIREVIALGGVAKKSPYIMQTVADVLEKKIKVVRSEQACALGAAMFAATAAGLYTTVGQAQKAMESGYETEYLPDKGKSARYGKLYQSYTVFGGFIESHIRQERAHA